MSTTYWNALLHLNYGCAVATCQIRPDGRTIEFSQPQHGRTEILVNETIALRIRGALQSGVQLLADVPLGTDIATPWRDDDCRRMLEQTLPAVDQFCAELQTRHDSLRDDQGTHAKAIDRCDCELSRLHRLIINSAEFARARLLS
jgi:hypothetical protein